MKRNDILLVLTLLCLASFSLSGCSTKEENIKTEPSNEQSTDTTDDLTDIDNLDDTKTPPADAEDPNYLTEDSTPLDEIQGEGTTDTSLPDFSNLDTSPLQTDCTITDDSDKELYSIQIETVTTTEQRDENNPSTPEKVVVVDYTYDNFNTEPLLLDDMSFKLIINNTVCTPYYAGFLSGAEAINEGEHCFSQLAYEVPSDAEHGTLIFFGMTEEPQLAFDLAF